MLSMEDILSVLFLERLRRKTPLPTESMSLKLANIKCGSGKGSELEYCRDKSAALILKFIAITCILFVGATGVSIPLLCKKCRFLRNDGNFFVAAKAFAAGVILATGFVHMLPDATSALTDSCLPSIPWSKFPFSGFFAMMAALLTLVVDFVGTQYYERKQGIGPTVTEQAGGIRVSDSVDADGESGIVSVVVEGKEWNGGEKKVVFGEEEGGRMHIVGIHAHAAHHRHNHPHGQEACYGYARKPLLEGEGQGHGNGGGHTHGHVHSHGLEEVDEVDSGIRHVVVSQVLELGIVSHSIIIGLSLGVSQSPCTIRPLIAALSFHQFFEGFALGGCISQAQFKSLSATIMACFFAITTPAGIGVGIAISSFYNPDSPRALITEGIFDSVSAGILVYMALVDLIAADFLSKRMRCNARLQVVSYFALFLGAILMSSLAIWA